MRMLGRVVWRGQTEEDEINKRQIKRQEEILWRKQYIDDYPEWDDDEKTLCF